MPRRQRPVCKTFARKNRVIVKNSDEELFDDVVTSSTDIFGSSSSCSQSDCKRNSKSAKSDHSSNLFAVDGSKKTNNSDPHRLYYDPNASSEDTKKKKPPPAKSNAKRAPKKKKKETKNNNEEQRNPSLSQFHFSEVEEHSLKVSCSPVKTLGVPDEWKSPDASKLVDAASNGTSSNVAPFVAFPDVASSVGSVEIFPDVVPKITNNISDEADKLILCDGNPTSCTKTSNLLQRSLCRGLVGRSGRKHITHSMSPVWSSTPFRKKLEKQPETDFSPVPLDGSHDVLEFVDSPSLTSQNCVLSCISNLPYKHDVQHEQRQHLSHPDRCDKDAGKVLPSDSSIKIDSVNVCTRRGYGCSDHARMKENANSTNESGLTTERARYFTRSVAAESKSFGMSRNLFSSFDALSEDEDCRMPSIAEENEEHFSKYHNSSNSSYKNCDIVPSENQTNAHELSQELKQTADPIKLHGRMINAKNIVERTASRDTVENYEINRKDITADVCLSFEKLSICQLKKTLLEKLFDECQQKEFLPFSKCIPPRMLSKCKKIGEGVFGEVFRTVNSRKQSVVLKIVPINGDISINGEPQKTIAEIWSEATISTKLSNLRREDRSNRTSNFVCVNRIRVAQGKYPQLLLDEWDVYDEKHKSENEKPDMFDQDQLYIMFEFGDGGVMLESFQFDNVLEAFSVVQQLVCTLAVAETAYEFEHRDLHWGNVLVKRTDDPFVSYIHNKQCFSIKSHGVHVTMIDFTLSRLRGGFGIVYADLAADPTLFTGENDYQFEIYRLMQKANGNNWERYCPYTNVLWIHYIMNKLLFETAYKRHDQDCRNVMEQLRITYDELLSFKSANNILEDCLFFSIKGER